MSTMPELQAATPAGLALGTFLISRLTEVASSAKDVVVEQESFAQFSAYLEQILPVAIELHKGKDFSRDVVDLMEGLRKDLDNANELIMVCTSKSKIYLLTHCRSILKQLEKITRDIGSRLTLIPLSAVQGHKDAKALADDLGEEMQHAQFRVKETEERICRTLERENGNIRNDVAVQTGILMDIARTVGVTDLSRNPSALRNEIDSLRKDLQDSMEAYDLHMLEIIDNIFENWVQFYEQPSPSRTGASQRAHMRVDPLYEAFICPLTKQVMRDPVTLETGQTYEKSAIERWFKECRENGRAPVCPMTGKQLESILLKPSIALRNTIEEWTYRNEGARIDNARMSLLPGSSEDDTMFGLKDLQSICQQNKLNRSRVRNAGLIPLIVEQLKSGSLVRCYALSTLRVLAEDDNDTKEAIGSTEAIRAAVKCLNRDSSQEREEAASLLLELSKSATLCEKIGATNGAILILVGLTSSKSVDLRCAQKAEQTLEYLEGCDLNVRQMAENGRLQPLLRRLVEGSEELEIEMANDLAMIPLTGEAKARVVELGGRKLVQMLSSKKLAAHEAALKALKSLSTLDSNAKLLIGAGILPPLVRDLFVVGVNQVPMKVKEVSATVLAQVVSSGEEFETVPIDDEGNTLASEVIVHNFLHLISNTGPAIEVRLLQVLVGLASSPNVVAKVVAYIKSAGAVVSLIQFLEAPQKDLRVIAVKLLNRLSPYMRQELADGLRVTTRQLGTLVRLIAAPGNMEEQAAAAGLLANLPTDDNQLTHAMLDEDALRILVDRILELRRGTVRGAGRFIDPFQEGLVGMLARFTFLLDEDEVVDLAKQYNLTVLFTSLLQTPHLHEVQKWSAVALQNLSTKSKQLSDIPDMPTATGCFSCFKAPPPMPKGLCTVHGGQCSPKESFCILEARAVVPLLALLDSLVPSVVEAALGALSTLLIDGVDVERGVQLLDQESAIRPILDILQEHKTELLRQRSVWMIERILRNGDMARIISGDPNVHTALVDAFRYGDYNSRQLAEKALKHLNKIPNFSGVFPRI